ncbi:MAG: caspase family protein [Dongia sp.]
MRRHRLDLRCIAIWVAGLAAIVASASPASAEPRVALVIGNSHYGGDLGLLPNPVNDAKLIAQTLRKVGFDVIEVEDADQQAMKKAIVDFGDTLSGAGAGATGLFFYAGHGIQSGGDNYLIPVHAALRKLSDVDVEAVPVDLVLKQMDFAQSAVNIVILDACRNNPLADSGRGITRGLAEIKTKPIGSFISYSTAPGEVAVDGNGVNSPYSAALAQAMLQPGLDLAEVFRKVRKDVLKATNQKQVPWDSWSLTDPYYFVPASAAPPLASGATVNQPESAPQQVAGVDPKQLDLTYWTSVQNSTDPADFQAYLDQFPNGVYAKLAANRLKALANTPGNGAAPSAEKDRTVPDQAPGAANGTLLFTAADKIVFTKDKTTLYTAPEETADIVAKPIAGLAIRAAGRSPDGGWWQLQLPNGRIAYARSIDIDEQAPAPAQPAAQADAGAAAGDQTAAADGQPQDAAAKQYFDLGQVLLEQGDLKGARDAFDKAAARNPKDAQAVLRRGQSALMMGDLDPALADFEQAVALDPNALEAHALRMLARLESGDAAGAAAAADQVQQVEPTFWSVTAIAAYYLAGKLPEAQAMAERVMQDSPEDARSWIWQSLVLRAQGRDGEAADLLQASNDNIGNRDWPVPVIEWMQGKRTPERLLVAAKSGDPATALRQISEADFYLGEAAYANGDRAAAERFLGQATDAKAPDLLAYAAAKALLAKMARE